MYSGQGQTPSPAPPSFTPPTTQRTQFEYIGEAFQLLQKQMGAWVGASAIAFGAILAVVVPFMVVAMGILFQLLQHRQPDINPIVLIGPTLWMFLGCLVLGPIVNGGLQFMAFKQLRQQPLSASDLFGALPRFGAIFGVQFLIGLVSMAVGLILSPLMNVLGPFANLISMIPSAILLGITALAMPLALDQGLSPMEALKESYNKVRSEFWLVTAFMALLMVILQVGGLLCGVGVLFTMPLYYLGTALLYRAFYPERFTDERGG